jgi:glutamine synthetase
LFSSAPATSPGWCAARGSPRRSNSPRSLRAALDGLAASSAARDWFGEMFFGVYLRFKRAELRVIDGLSEAAVCARYAEIY